MCGSFFRFAMLFCCWHIACFAVRGEELPLAAETLTRDYAILTKQGIASTPEGALGYLKSFIPAKTSPAEAAAFVKRLGSDDYRQREAAVAELIRIPDFPEAVLAAATESNDLEIRWRARTVLEQRGRRDWRSFQAALRILSEQPTPDTLDVVLELSASIPKRRIKLCFTSC